MRDPEKAASEQDDLRLGYMRPNRLKGVEHRKTARSRPKRGRNASVWLFLGLFKTI